MSVLIKGMEMPKKQVCVVLNPNGLVEVLDANNVLLEEYQAAPVPPHGRLIDADALKSVLKWHHSVFIGAEDQVEKAQSDALICAISEVVNAPTIIPAEEGE